MQHRAATPTIEARPFGWVDIVRLGLVQVCLGGIVVLTTSTLNRVMVVELALPALLPGLLVALHYLVQVVRPRMGFGSDVGGRRTPWIVGGLALLALGGIGAALATVWMAESRAAGFLLGMLSFVLIGVGVSAAGTSLLVLLAMCVPSGPARGGGHHGVADDDRRLCRHRRLRRTAARSVLTNPVAGRDADRLHGRDDYHADRPVPA